MLILLPYEGPIDQFLCYLSRVKNVLEAKGDVVGGVFRKNSQAGTRAAWQGPAPGGNSFRSTERSAVSWLGPIPCSLAMSSCKLKQVNAM